MRPHIRVPQVVVLARLHEFGSQRFPGFAPPAQCIQFHICKQMCKRHSRRARPNDPRLRLHVASLPPIPSMPCRTLLLKQVPQH